MIHNCLPADFISIPVLRSYSEETDDLIDKVADLGGVVLGGYARWSMSPYPVPPPFTDLDIFTDEDNVKSIDSLLRDSLTVYARRKNRSPYMNQTFEAATFSRFSKVGVCLREYRLPERIQLITNKNSELNHFYDKTREFDFTICQAALCSSRVGYFTYQGYKDEKSKVLNLNRCRNIHSIPIRLMSYLNKGYEVPDKTFNQILSVIPPNKTYAYLRKLEYMLDGDYEKPVSWMKKLKFLIYSLDPNSSE